MSLKKTKQSKDMKDALHKDVHISERWNVIFQRQPASLVRHVPPFAKTGVSVSLASLMSLQRHQRCQRQTRHFPDEEDGGDARNSYWTFRAKMAIRKKRSSLRHPLNSFCSFFSFLQAAKGDSKGGDIFLLFPFCNLNFLSTSNFISKTHFFF